MGAPLCITDLQLHREDVLLESRDCGQKLPAKVIALIDNNKKTPWLPESFHFEKKLIILHFLWCCHGKNKLQALVWPPQHGIQHWRCFWAQPLSHHSLLCNTRQNCACLVDLWITLWDARAWMKNVVLQLCFLFPGKRWLLGLGTLFLHNAKSNLKMSVSDLNVLSTNQELLLSQRSQSYFVI